MTKQTWLSVAEVVDALRVVPRVLLFAYGSFVLYAFNDLIGWYQQLAEAERTLEASGLVTLLIGSITGMGAWFSKLYLLSGRKWNGHALKPEDL